MHATVNITIGKINDLWLYIYVSMQFLASKLMCSLITNVVIEHNIQF